MKKYLDQLKNSHHQEAIWKTIALSAFVVMGILAITIGVLAANLVSNIDRVRYMIAPGVQALTVVRPGELPKSYIEQSFRYVTDQLNSWSYESIEDNYKTLFEQFYSNDLKTRTQANLRSMHYLEDVRNRNLVSFWNIKAEDSEFHWCGKVAMRSEVKGVACGIVTGVQRLFADHNVPISTKPVSYLIYAVNVAPTPNNFFAVEITRIKRGPLAVLKAELEQSLKDGVLSPEDESDATH